MERRAALSSSVVQIPKAAQVIADTLRRRIVLGALAPGDALPNEPELMSEFGVSRASLREALRILETEALIEVRRGAKGGVRIRRPSDEVAANAMGALLQMRGATLDEVLEALEIIEPPLMGTLAARRSEADLEVFRAHIERERALIDDFPAFSQATTDLHRILAERSKNAVLALILVMLDEIFRRHAPHFVARARPDQLKLNERGFANHAALVDMIAARNAAAAEAVWRAHMAEVKAVILSELGGTMVLDLY
ncbi:MAG TPA: GntR family transcriptional regulator [Phenylobacterium sp.]|jgi:DNA-binding FadR family transcriptional regulator|nr:GntR family transcriptional regulator [Phenylobacterium sp.]